MTEAEWMACTDPRLMLKLLRGRASERKLRLFLVACARTVWDQITDPVMRRAVDTAERYVDGRAASEEHQTAHGEVYRLACDRSHFFSDKASMMGVSIGQYMSFFGLSLSCGFSKAALDTLETTNAWASGAELTAHLQPSILRDIFGHSFQPATIASTLLDWNNSTVVNLAQSIYEDRAFDHLPGLADALEDAGCHDIDILAHCRQPGTHIRGCWVVDLLLGKR